MRTNPSDGLGIYGPLVGDFVVLAGGGDGVGPRLKRERNGVLRPRMQAIAEGTLLANFPERERLALGLPGVDGCVHVVLLDAALGIAGQDQANVG